MGSLTLQKADVVPTNTYWDAGPREWYKETDSINFYVNEIRKFEVLGREKELELFIQYKHGDLSAKEQIINGNLRLVSQLAGIYSRKYQYEYLDLVQEGNIGLIVAVEKFDYTQGFRFTTYAVYWIQQHMQRSINAKSQLIRVPDYFADALNQVRRFEDNYKKTHGKAPSIEEISEGLHLKVTKVMKLKTNAPSISSLNAYICKDTLENGEISDLLQDYENDYARDPADIVVEKEIQEKVNNIIDRALDKREADIIRSRFGMVDGVQMTLEAVGKRHAITRERARQIERDAKQKIEQIAIRENLIQLLG